MSHAVTRPKHIPQRICIVCRNVNPKRGLIRLVRTATGGVQIDGTGKQNGRGAYVCQQVSCWHTLVERNIVVSALRLTLLTEEDRAALVSFARTIDTSA
ncbi:MAG: YlxR family protein [Chloroflexia bacterium]|nr:YlxR family protein [Chloroflexia bacterium]